MKSKWRRAAKSAARTLLHKLGGLEDVRFWNRDEFRILMYHDFPSSLPEMQESLARQCDHMARHYQVLSLTDMAGYLRAGKRLPRHSVAVTVDDGNRDFLLNGYPIFRAYRIPVTVFLVSGFLDRKLWLWWDQIDYLLANARQKIVELGVFPTLPLTSFCLETLPDRQDAVSKISWAVKELTVEERVKVLERLSQLVGVDVPDAPPPEWSPLDWSEVRELSKNHMDFGAHTVTHPRLSHIQDPEELRREIGDCKRKIEDVIGRPVLHFCYPYGRWNDFNDQTVKTVEACQFQTAVTAEHGLNYRESNLFKLRRIPVDAGTPEMYFQESLAGLHMGNQEEERMPFA